MSKKKAFSGNTMTLKDFHGGSIPTDLPLPSAPGVTVRSSGWSGSDRPNSWGGPMGRPDHRARPNSSPATRILDDKTPFLSHPAHIGRHFDEDERKPLDGVSAPRRTVSDDSFRVAPSRVELKPEPPVNGRVLGSAAVSQAANSHSGKVGEGAHVGANVGGNIGPGGSYPNVWAARKELPVGFNKPVQSAWSEESAVSKLVNASALEKVSSGRWQSRHSIQYQAEVEVIEHLEQEKDLGPRGHDVYANNRMGHGGVREYSDATLARDVGRLALEDGIQSGRKEYVDNERMRAAPQVRSPRTDGRFSGSDVQPRVESEAFERPKVKLLPRTKPLEGLEAPVTDYKQGYQQPISSVNGHAETTELPGNKSAIKSSLAGVESENQAIERPKLNLRPRALPVEQPEENREKERVALFGGARPREVVLKERGVNGAAASNHDLAPQPDRIKHNVPEIERGPKHAIPTCNSERTENMHLDQKTGKIFKRKDQRTDIERVDKQRRNWRNSSMKTERQQPAQSQQERPPSPETWRKPEQPKPASPDATGLRYGKTASALELAQAFSKSLSDPRPTDQYSGERGLPGKTQTPFSRLTGPTPRPQINGY